MKRRMPQWLTLLLLAVVLTAALPSQASSHALPLATQEAEDPDTNPAAVEYVRFFGVSYEEAQRRLALQYPMSLLAEKVAEGEPTYFASWIQHEPEFRLIVAFSGPNGAEIMGRYLEGVEWADQVETRQSDITLDELLQIRNQVRSAALETGIPFNSGIDLPSEKVRLYTAQVSELRSRLETRGLVEEYMDDIVFIEQESPLVPATFDYPYLPGGSANSGLCTNGFVLKRVSDGRRFMSTAGHCPNSLYVKYGGQYSVYLGPVAYESPFAHTDLQVHDVSARSLDLTNVIQTGTNPWDRRKVVDSEVKYYTLYEWVCKYGQITHYTCGRVEDLYIDPDDAYVLVENNLFKEPDGSLSDYDIGCPGDSGSPVFQEVTQGESVSGLGILTAVTAGGCDGGNYQWVHLPFDKIQAAGFQILTDEYPQQYYLHVFTTGGTCTEYQTPIDDDGEPIWGQQDIRSCAAAPGSGTLTSYNGFVVGQNWREGLYRGSNEGWARAVPLYPSGTINWGGAVWGQCCDDDAPAAQDGYIVGNRYYLNVFAANGSCVEHYWPLDNNGSPIWTSETAQACRTAAPGTGTVQSYNAYVVGEQLREGMWRGGQGWVRELSLNATNTDVAWPSPPTSGWGTCCAGGTAPAAQGGEITSHP